jgi:sulfate-transporting ATPase
VAAVIVVGLVGLLFAVPALRTRGVTLAIVTLALGLTIQKLVLGNRNLVLGFAGTPVDSPTLFGWHIDMVDHPKRYAATIGIVFVLLACVAMNLRAGAVGRRLLAVRSNERAAAALGVRVAGVKLFAFLVSSAIAAVAGVYLAFRANTAGYEQFDVLSSLNVVVYTLIGGVGFAHGALIAATAAPGTLVAHFFPDSLQYVFAIVGGALLIVTLVVNPHGLAYEHVHMAHRLLRRAGKGADDHSAEEHAHEVDEAAHQPIDRVRPLGLRAEGVSVRFGGVVANDDVSIELVPGLVTAVIGANGAGKSTLIDALTGFNRATSRGIYLGEERIDGWSADKRARAGLTRTFQSVDLFDDLTVRENLLLATDELRWWRWALGALKPQEPPMTAATAALVARFGLGEWLDRDPADLPYGLRRLVALVRAAAGGHSVVLLDEPAAGLDRTDRRKLGEVIRWLAHERGVAILLVEHDVDLVLGVADHVVALDFGSVIFNGSPSEVAGDPAVQAAYLGVEEPALTDVDTTPDPSAPVAAPRTRA